MTARDFCYWLQGFFELRDAEQSMTAMQSEIIKRHLSMVFAHEIDPTFGDKKKQDALNAIHHLSNDPIVRC